MKHDPVECCKVSLQGETSQRITGEHLEHIAYSNESVHQLLTKEQEQQQYLAMKIMAVVRHLPYSCDLTPYNCFR
jgi:precorrin-6B methylase 1